MEKISVHIAVCVPLYREIPIPTFISLLNAFFQLPKYFQKVTIHYKIDTIIHRARAELLSEVLSKDTASTVTHILWIDSDQVFTINDILELYRASIHSNADLLSGVYISRTDPQKVQFYYNEKQGYGHPVEFPQNKLIEVDAVGLGFCLMNVQLIKTLLEKYTLPELFIDVDSKTGQLLGEDFAFCKKVKQNGFTIRVQTSVKIGHYGGVITPDIKQALDAMTQTI